jgi:hypothetical protein
MNDAVTIALNTYAPQRGLAPGASEGVNIARVIVNELDTARFDPLLVQTVARNAAKVLTGLKTRIDGMLVRDFTATSLTGQQATPAEMINGQLVSCLYHLTLSLGNLEGQFGSKVSGILVPTIVALEETYRKTTDALDIAIKREFGNILARIHRVDFSKPVDPMAMGSGASPYMQDLVDKIGFLRTEVLSRMSMGEYMRQWVLALSRFLIRTFLLHASIARPMGESGRLKLTGNMTEFEMSLQNFLMTGRVQGSGSKTGLKVSQIGDEYYALRAFRQLLFADAAGLVNPAETAPLPPLVVAHHAVVRSPLRLPHEVRGWSEHEYVLWLDKHTDDEAWDLLESTAAAQVEGEDAADEDRAALGMVRTVLTHARHHHEKDAQPHQH